VTILEQTVRVMTSGSHPRLIPNVTGTNSACPTAFHNSGDTGVQVACQADNVSAHAFSVPIDRCNRLASRLILRSRSAIETPFFLHNMWILVILAECTSNDEGFRDEIPGFLCRILCQGTVCCACTVEGKVILSGKPLSPLVCVLSNGHVRAEGDPARVRVYFTHFLRKVTRMNLE